MPFRLLLLAAFTLCCSHASAQTFKSGVDLIRFDVRIVDQNGKPITDLKQDEIVDRGAGSRVAGVAVSASHRAGGIVRGRGAARGHGAGLVQ